MKLKHNKMKEGYLNSHDTYYKELGKTVTEITCADPDRFNNDGLRSN